MNIINTSIKETQYKFIRVTFEKEVKIYISFIIQIKIYGRNEQF